MTYLLERLTEPSTWRGIFAFLTGVGIAISPEYVEAITATGISVIGLIGVATKDAK